MSGLYKATLNAYRIDSRGNKIIIAGEWESINDMLFSMRRNQRPVVQILDTTRERVARNGVISLSGTASDPDYGSSIISTEWLINGSVDYIATGTSAEVPVDSGENLVYFQATDAQGETDGSSTGVYVVVNHAPVVVISGGDRSLPDTDGDAGETVAVSATATDSDGNVSSTEWLVDGAVVATGTSANLALDDGSTTVTFRATDDGRTADDSTTVMVPVQVRASRSLWRRQISRHRFPSLGAIGVFRIPMEVPVRWYLFLLCPQTQTAA